MCCVRAHHQVPGVLLPAQLAPCEPADGFHAYGVIVNGLGGASEECWEAQCIVGSFSCNGGHDGKVRWLVWGRMGKEVVVSAAPARIYT